MKMKAQEKIYNAVVENACDPLREQFKFQHVDFCGEEAILVTPAIQGTSWNQVNKYFRSVIYRKSDYTVLSSGFPKFVNYGENVENFPPPKQTNLKFSFKKSIGDTLLMFIFSNTSTAPPATRPHPVITNLKLFGS